LNPGASRRAALKMALGVGYAVAAMPVMTQTAIKTPFDGLQTGEVSYDVAGFQVPAYFAAPEGRAHLPVVLVIHEVLGVHEYIADICRRFARAGYLAIAPELYARQGDPSAYGELGKLLTEVVNQVPDAQVLGDLDGAVRWASAHGGDTTKVAVTGFCWGGRIAWLYAAHAPIRAAVAWYGSVVGMPNAFRPQNPIDVAARMRAPVLGLYGEQDGGIPLDTLDKMKTVLVAGTEASRASRFVVYPDAPHAFHADYRTSFRAGPAEDGWKRCLAWFKAHGVA
jgi:carboxymethylenebutenolidase